MILRDSLLISNLPEAFLVIRSAKKARPIPVIKCSIVHRSKMAIVLCPQSTIETQYTGIGPLMQGLTKPNLPRSPCKTYIHIKNKHGREIALSLR